MGIDGKKGLLRRSTLLQIRDIPHVDTNPYTNMPIDLEQFNE